MSLFTAFNKASYALFEMFKGPVNSYCRLETADNVHTLVADDGSLLSAIRVEGTLARVCDSQYHLIINTLTEKMQPILSVPGHTIQIVFEYNPLIAHKLVRDNFAPSRTSAKELKIDLDVVLTDWEDTIAKYCSGEFCWIVIWTHASILSDVDQKKALKEVAKNLKSEPLVFGCQATSRGIEAIRYGHTGAVAAMLQALKSSGVLAWLEDAHEFVKDMRFSVDPHVTQSDWKPLLPGDHLPAGYPDLEEHPLHNLLYPSLSRQIFPREGEILSRSMIRIGDQIHAPFVMALPPQDPKPFNVLFQTMTAQKQKAPLRMCMTVKPDGLGGLGFKTLLAQILSFTSPANKQLVAATNALRELSIGGYAIVQFSMCFDTWVDLTQFRDQTEAIATLRRQFSETVKLIAGWGTSTMQEITGDPLLGTVAAMPGMMPTGGPAPKAAAPLNATWVFMPMRPASSWKHGSLLFRTPAGKLMPFAPNSSEQASWIDIGVAPMGGGKSVLLNTINFAFCFQAGLTRLPWVSIIDVGPSSSGLISLISSALPEDKQHLVAYHRLRMTKEYAVNPFDTPLGCRRPLPSHQSFLVNLLCLLSTPLDATAPPSGISGIARGAIEAAYQELEDKSHPKLFNKVQSEEIYNLLLKENMPFDDRTTWWEVVDFLFEHGHVHEAHLAQRYAVPVLSDISKQMRQNQGLKITYNFEMPGSGEHILDYAWRCIQESISAYPILSEPTKFSLGDAQIVSLDLDEVAPRGGASADRQSAVMYMLARHIVGSRFFMMPNDVPLMPELYQEYHGKLINEIRQDPKRLCYDEVHRVTSQEAVAAQIIGDLTTSARESRKWNLSIGLYSQTYEDFPKVILELATSIFILGSGTEAGRRGLAETFGLNSTIQVNLENLGKPGPHGSNLIALFRTSSGTTQQMLTNTIGPVALWAFSSTTEDVTVRNALYKQFGVSKTLTILAKKYPGGIKNEAERRKLNRKEGGVDDMRVDVLQELVNELSQDIGHTFDEMTN